MDEIRCFEASTAPLAHQSGLGWPEIRRNHAVALAVAWSATRPSLGKRSRSRVSSRWAHTYSDDRIISPISRNSTPCRMGRNRPRIPSRMKTPTYDQDQDSLDAGFQGK